MTPAPAPGPVRFAISVQVDGTEKWMWVHARDIVQDEIFPDKVKLIGAIGIEDGQLPNFRVRNFSIEKSKIGNIYEGEIVVPPAEKTPPAAQPEDPPEADPEDSDPPELTALNGGKTPEETPSKEPPEEPPAPAQNRKQRRRSGGKRQK